MLRIASSVVVLTVIAGGGHRGSAEPNEILTVRVDDPNGPFAFEPTRLEVEAGTTVRWRNTTDQAFHTVTFTDSLDRRVANGAFDASLFAAGDTVEFTFEEPGTYDYFCQPHSTFMAGTIVVSAPDLGRSFWSLAVVYVGIFTVAVAAGHVVRPRLARHGAGRRR